MGIIEGVLAFLGVCVLAVVLIGLPITIAAEALRRRK